MPSPEGRLLVGADNELTPALYVWEIGTEAAAVATFPTVATLRSAGNFEFSPDGRSVAANHAGGVFGPPGGAVLWDLNPDRVYHRMCDLRQAPVGSDRWRGYFPHLAYRSACA